jgi:hypothetical protein
MARKAFTVAEANALVPVMEKVLERIRRAETEAREQYEKLQILDALWGDSVAEPANPDHGEFLSRRAGIALAVREIEEIVRTEILMRGIRFPAGGLEHGLLDFPTTWEGRWVYLCWQCGEPSLHMWHEVSGGYAGRQEITAEHERRMGTEDDPDELDDSGLDR